MVAITQKEDKDKIPGDLFDRLMGTQADALFEHISLRFMKDEDFRQRIIAIICEHVDSVAFMKKVREYASDEINSKLFVSVKFWITTILAAVVTSGIGALIIYLTS